MLQAEREVVEVAFLGVNDGFGCGGISKFLFGGNGWIDSWADTYCRLSSGLDVRLQLLQVRVVPSLVLCLLWWCWKPLLLREKLEVVPVVGLRVAGFDYRREEEKFEFEDIKEYLYSFNFASAK